MSCCSRGGVPSAWGYFQWTTSGVSNKRHVLASRISRWRRRANGCGARPAQGPDGRDRASVNPEEVWHLIPASRRAIRRRWRRALEGPLGVPAMAWLHQRTVRQLCRLRMVIRALDADAADAGHCCPALLPTRVIAGQGIRVLAATERAPWI